MTLDRKHILVGLALVAGLTFLYVILGRAVHEPSAALPRLESETPFALPPVHFVDAAGREHSLSEFRGRFILLNLWAPWCAPCIRELPALSHLARLIGPSRLAIVAVAIPPGDPGSTARFLRENEVENLPAFFDKRAALLRSLRVRALPVTILVTPDGMESARALGAQSWDQKAALDDLRQLTGS
ncbi:MAG: TlpA family protein disulfide reductase [Alphaproteobacteria bacterium]|nr:TlpA family protein disulfide reductase [Alphaproteobacteria bacterium]